MPLSDLSPQQQQAFADGLKELGMDPSQVIPAINSKTHPGPVTLSPDPSESTIKPIMVTIKNVDEAKRLAGNKDSDYTNGLMEEHHAPLPAWPQHKNTLDAVQLSADENNLIKKAHTAYIYGNSANVHSYKDIIDKHNYPAQVACFAVEDICVDSTNSPFKIGPAGLTCGTLTICEGGSIQFTGNATVNCQKMVKSDATSCKQ
jgi:hypothetical protein